VGYGDGRSGLPSADGMSWGEAATWTTVAAAGALVAERWVGALLK
jgi:hypothetical protein